MHLNCNLGSKTVHGIGISCKAKKANIMSSIKVNASLPESQGQGQDLRGQGQDLRGQGQGQGLDLRGQGQGQGLDYRGQGQGQGQANLASRRLEAKAMASRTTSLINFPCCKD